ncbi:hypothetical protein [Halorhabdus amylolytica]|uniref:hypothetical protein n=1 Tax=Halorhabdus amylolytica TaxID=2559573 RepID=UPI0010AAE23A|nr:hypothetical protein [Halorhabdus amylolytica]
MIENVAKRSLAVSITVVEDGYDATLETDVSGGETYVRREFVAADPGDIVTLAARFGESGDPATFEFSPTGARTTLDRKLPD